MGVAEPGLRPPVAASQSAKSIQEDEIPPAVMVGRMKKFSENTSTIPEVMDTSTLNCEFLSKFYVFTIFFLGGGTPSPFGCVLVSLG